MIIYFELHSDFSCTIELLSKQPKILKKWTSNIKLAGSLWKQDCSYLVLATDILSLDEIKNQV